MAKASAVIVDDGKYTFGLSGNFTGRGSDGEPIFENKEFTDDKIDMTPMIERVQRAIPADGTEAERINAPTI
jgi:hypothetical protein